MLFAVGNIDMNLLLDGIIGMAKDETSVHELNEEKGQGSWTHADGWGISYLNEKGEWIIEKSTEAIFEDPDVDKFRSIKTNLAIVHVRKKMGSEKSIYNTHPFTIQKDNPGSYVFCHNGFIDEDIFFDSSFKLKGETDSEKLFYSILTDLKKENLVKALRKNFKRYKKLTGTNIILSTKESSVIAIRENHFPRYYRMNIGINEESFIISSEKLDNIANVIWQPLEQGDIIRIDNKNLKIDIHKLKKPILQRTLSRLRSSSQKYLSVPLKSYLIPPRI